MKYLNQFLKTTGVFFIGNSLTKLISFFLLPLYTSRIEPESFGYFDLSISLLNLIIPLVYFQIWDSVYRYTFDYDTVFEKYIVISNGAVLHIISMFVYSIIFFLMTNYVDIDHKHFIYVYGLLFAMQYYYSFVTRSLQKNFLLVSTGFLNTLISLSLNVILIYFLDMGIEALYLSFIIGTSIQILFLEYKLKLLLNINIKKISIKFIKKLIFFALPLCLTTLSYWFLTGITRVIVSSNLGTYYTGLFAITNRLSSIVILTVNILQFAWFELTYSISKEKKKKHYYNYSINFIIKVVCFIGSIFLLIIKLIFPLLIDQQYQDAIFIVPITFIGVLINSYASFASTLFLAEKNSNKLVMPAITSAFINVVALFLLTPYFGLIGATFSLALAFLVNAVIITINLININNININYFSLSAGLLTLICTTVFYYLVDDKGINILGIILLIIASLLIFKNVFVYLLKEIKVKIRKKH
jgi:O-antigen/teichoic acid export membrane protein